MKKYLNIAIFLTLVGAVVLSPVARAEDGNRGPGGAGFRDERKALIQTFRDDREEFKATMKAEREAFVAKLKSDRETFLAELKAKKEEFKNKTLEAKNEWRGRALTMIGTSFEMAIRNLEMIQTRVGEIIDDWMMKIRLTPKHCSLSRKKNSKRQKINWWISRSFCRRAAR